MSSFHFQIITLNNSHFEFVSSMSQFWPVFRRLTQIIIFLLKKLRQAFQNAGSVSSCCFVRFFVCFVFVCLFFDNATRTSCVMPDPVATYKWSAPVFAKEQTTTKRKQTKRAFQARCSAFGRWWWRVFSINQSINHSVSLLGRAEIVLKRQICVCVCCL